MKMMWWRRSPARTFEIEYKAYNGTDRVHVNVPAGASVNANSNKFLVYDEDNDLVLFGYNHVVSFKDVTPKEADNG